MTLPLFSYSVIACAHIKKHVHSEPGWASRAYLAGVWEGLVVVGAILQSALCYVAAGVVPQRVLTCGEGWRERERE